jgi:hypothetical protein
MISQQRPLAGLARRAYRQGYNLFTERPFRLHLPLLLLLALLLVVIAYQALSPPTVAVGERDRRFISDANALEMLPDIGRWIRWTRAETHLALPVVTTRTPHLLELTLFNSYPPGQPTPTVDVVIGDEWLTRLVVERLPAGPRHYRMLIPPQERPDWNLPITLESSTIILEQDPRPIGVALIEARPGILGGRPLLPPLWQVFAMLVYAAAGYLTLRGIGAGRWLAWAIAAVLVLALAAGLLFWHLQVAPFTMRLAGLLSLGALYGLAVHLLTGARGQPGASPARIALLMGLAFWLMPAYQLLMTLDGARSVTPYPPTFWVGAATLTACVVTVGALLDMERGRAWKPALLAILAVAAVVHLGVMIDFALGRSGPDFWILFRGARDWWRGGSMYNLVAVQENHFGHVFKVPPFYGMLFLPFVQQDGLMILFWHRMLNSALLAATVLLCFRAFGVYVASALGVGLLMLFNMRPLADVIAYGQVDILLLLLLVVAVAALQRGRDGLAGAAVALGTLFKLYPALLLVFFVLKRQWRALIGFVAAMLLCNGLAVILVGWDLHATYLFGVLPRIGGGTSWVENQTINGFVSRLFAEGITAEKFDHPLVSFITYGCFLLALAGAAWLARRPAERHSPRFVLQFGLFVVLMVLTVPAAWMHYQTIVILPFFGLLLYAAERGSVPRWRAALLGIAYALIAYGNQWSFFDGTVMGGLTVLGVSYKFYGLLLLAVVIVACLLDRRAEAQHA